MQKLLTSGGRSTFALILLICSLAIIAGAVPFIMKPPADDFWKNAGTIVTFSASYIVLGLALYLAFMPFTTEDLIKAAHKRLAEEGESAKAWKSVIIKRESFREMSVWVKLVCGLCILSGIGLWLYAGADILGWVHPLKFKALNGTIVPAPMWETSVGEFAGGCVSFLLVNIIRTKVIDKWEERFRHYLKQVDDEFGHKK